jgi:hypothetical protein
MSPHSGGLRPPLAMTCSSFSVKQSELAVHSVCITDSTELLVELSFKGLESASVLTTVGLTAQRSPRRTPLKTKVQPSSSIAR